MHTKSHKYIFNPRRFQMFQYVSTVYGLVQRKTLLDMLIRLRIVQDSTYNFVEFGRWIEHHHISPLIFTPQMDLRHQAWNVVWITYTVRQSQSRLSIASYCMNFTMKNTREHLSNVWTESPWPSLRDFVNRQLIAWNELCVISCVSKNWSTPTYQTQVN